MTSHSSAAGAPADPGAPDDAFDPFAEGDLESVVPTTEPQREVWLASNAQPESSLSYNESVTLTLRGDLDSERLTAAISALMRRHQSLRATLTPDGMSLCIARSLAVEPVVTDLSALEDSQRREALADIQQRHVYDSFDLERGPLVRWEIVRLGPAEHALILTAHHLVCDGWSLGIVLRDLAAEYRSPGTLPPVSLEFSQYAAERAQFLDSAEYRALENFWVRELADVGPALELPTDFARRAPRSYRSERFDGTIPADAVARIKTAGARLGASLFVTLLSGFSALLARMSGQYDFVVGIPAAGQNTEGHDGLVGHLVHLLPMRVRTAPQSSLEQLAKDLRAAVLDAFEHQGYTYGSLLRKLSIERDASRPTLVGVTFNLDQAVELRDEFPGLAVECRTNPRAFENFDLAVNIVPEDGALRAEFQFASELFTRETIERWFAAWCAILERLTNDAACTIDSLELLGAADREAWQRLNATEAPNPSLRSVHELVLAQCRRTPQRVAIQRGDATMSYAQLAAEAQALAAELARRGVAAGARVGISLDREPRMLVAMLAVLMRGAAYVPLDPAFPAERLAFMARDADLALILCDASSEQIWRDAEASARLRLDEWAPGSSAVSSGEQASSAPIDPESAAYLIYTSGSTGRPKGVAVPHRAVINFLESMRRRPGLGDHDVLLAVTTLSFDIAVLELLLPLYVGARVVLATRDQAIDGQALRDLIAHHQVTTMQATPSTWRLLLEGGWSGTPSLKALCGGESLPAELAKQLVVRTASLWNMYGPTETTVWSSTALVAGDESSIHIGQPIANTEIWVLDDARRPCPLGVRGEIWIGGLGVAIGYWQRPELTAERFIPDPFSKRPGARLYRTGDVGFLRADGAIECLGRTDFQVKIRGHRIELGEIESALAAHASVQRCVVDARAGAAGDLQLCAYVIWRDGERVDAQELREFLRRSLPEYMVPPSFTTLERIPLTPNGKVDRRALPPPDAALDRGGAGTQVPPQTPREIELASVWCELLALPAVGRFDNFFDLGGHSLLAMRAIARMQQVTGRRIGPSSYVLENLSQIASRYDEAAAANDAAHPAAAEASSGLWGRLKSGLLGRK